MQDSQRLCIQCPFARKTDACVRVSMGRCTCERVSVWLCREVACVYDCEGVRGGDGFHSSREKAVFESGCGGLNVSVSLS